MATNKAKRSIHLAQLQAPQLNHQPAALAPVKPHVYYAIAELNAGLERPSRTCTPCNATICLALPAWPT